MVAGEDEVGQRGKRVALGRRREPLDRILRRFRVTHRPAVGVVDRTVRAKQPAQLGPRRIVDLARIDCGTDDCVGAAPLPFLLDQADSRERQLPVAQVTADRLAERLPVGREVEQVIDELERDAEIEAVVAQRRALLRRRVGQPATDLGRAAEEVRRLPLDDVEVLRLGDIDVTRFPPTGRTLPRSSVASRRTAGGPRRSSGR